MKRIVIKTNTKEALDLLRPLEDILKSQANVKSVEYLPLAEDWHELILEVLPNPNAIGKVYRQWSSKIAVMLKNRPAQDIRDSIAKGEYSLGIEGQVVRIEPNMVSFSTSLPDKVSQSEFSNGTIYLDFNTNEELEAEGYAREIIRRIQQMRKDMKLDVEEFIRAEIRSPATIAEYFKAWKAHIMDETRCQQMDFVDVPQGEYAVNWEVEGQKVDIALSSLRLREGVKNLMAIPGMTQQVALSLVKGGYKTVEALKPLSEQALSEVPGLSKTDARYIHHFLNRVEQHEKVEPDPGEKRTDDIVENKEKMLGFLLRVPRMNELKAEMLIEAGYNTVEKIIAATPEELKSVKGLGAKTIQELRDHAEKGGFITDVVCKSCGAKIPPSAMACSKCGKPVDLETEEDGDAETKKEKAAPVLQPSSSYLVKEDKGDRSYELFVQLLNKGMNGFCVTRDYPQKVKSRFNLGDVPILWLSSIGKENSLRPKDLEKLSFSLEQFLSNKGGVILLDGLEYLITNNNFLTVLRFIQSLRDQVAINHSILLIALNPSTLDPHELNLLEKELDLTL